MHSAIDLNELVATAADAIIVADAAGAITLWNPAAERIFGFSESEAMGRSLDLITPERHQKRHWDGYHQTMKTGVTRYSHDTLRVPAVHKDGHALSIAFTVSLLRGGEESPAAIVAIIRDETKRWTEERDLRRRITELEAKLTETEAKPAN
jgi:PAS domain S-box-containing protein